ncbi:prepilin-type N-terminal cleavage/methylation domain-containing protein [Pseudomonas sp. PLMAX]|uniref:prepilin-type N-terminal cleavage/methylation domain-containing protein n=1 Tax=Pseudomonas sp. PLMAX TaxID=2201998 RepID=UPI0038BA9C4D
MRNNQHGVTLIEMIMVLALMAVATMLSFYEKQTDLEQARARQVGGLLFQYNNAVRARIAKGDITTAQNNIGSAWLKNSSCGGPFAVGKEYLPCEFPAADITDPISFGRLTLASAVTVSGTPPNRKVKATTTSTPFILYSQGNPTVRADLSGLATLSAAAALMSGFQTGSSGNSPLTATTDSSYKSDPITAKMTMIASNSADSDVWLRTDGGNAMHASLNFDSTDGNNRQILGASRVQNFTGQVLHLGSGASMTPVTTASVVVDSNTEILGDFRVRQSANVDGNVTAQGDVTAQGSVNGRTGNFTNSVNTHQGNFSGTVNALAVISSHQVEGTTFIDADDRSYQMKPAATSTLRDINVKNSGTIKYLTSDEVGVNSALSVNGYIYLNGRATLGWGCLTNGQMGSDATGKVLSCQGGIWSGNGFSVSAPVVLAAIGFTPSFAQCFANPRNAMIMASGPGDSQLVVDGVQVGVSGSWGGKYSDVALDSVISAVVAGGKTFCYYSTASTGMGRSNGVRVVATYLE